MKVYRIFTNDYERNLFEQGIIFFREPNIYEKEKLYPSVNTHDYDNEKNRKHFFIFIEDASNYGKKYLKDKNIIGEYDIPLDLVIPNIGIGFYKLLSNIFVLETSIPKTSLIDLDIKYIKTIEYKEIEESVSYKKFYDENAFIYIMKILNIKLEKKEPPYYIEFIKNGNEIEQGKIIKLLKKYHK